MLSVAYTVSDLLVQQPYVLAAYYVPFRRGGN